MRSLRFWSRKAQLLAAGCAAILLAILITALTVPEIDAVVLRWTSVAAVTVALTSLIVTAIAASANWRRQRREAAIDAWNEWSDSTVTLRNNIGARLGTHRISIEQARALIYATPLPGTLIPTSPEEQVQLLRDIRKVLNGLERLAIGTDMGVYDFETVRKLGGTIIARWHDRFQPYIELRRSIDDRELQQARAFVAFSAFSRSLERKTILLRRRQLDEERIANLRRPL